MKTVLVSLIALTLTANVFAEGFQGSLDFVTNSRLGDDAYKMAIGMFDLDLSGSLNINVKCKTNDSFICTCSDS